MTHLVEGRTHPTKGREMPETGEIEQMRRYLQQSLLGLVPMLISGKPCRGTIKEDKIIRLLRWEPFIGTSLILRKRKRS